MRCHVTYFEVRPHGFLWCAEHVFSHTHGVLNTHFKLLLARKIKHQPPLQNIQLSNIKLCTVFVKFISFAFGQSLLGFPPLRLHNCTHQTTVSFTLKTERFEFRLVTVMFHLKIAPDMFYSGRWHWMQKNIFWLNKHAHRRPQTGIHTGNGVTLKRDEWVAWLPVQTTLNDILKVFVFILYKHYSMHLTLKPAQQGTGRPNMVLKQGTYFHFQM